MSLSNELFNQTYSMEAASPTQDFDAYFKDFTKKGSKVYGRLISMSKKLKNEDNKVDTYVKSLKTKVRLLDNPTSMVKNVTDHITAELLFNDVLCKYKTIYMNKGTARKHCDAHIGAIKSLLDSEAMIKQVLTENQQEASRVVKNYKQLCKHVMWSATRLVSRIRLTPYAGAPNSLEELGVLSVSINTVSNEGIFDWFKKKREEAKAKEKERQKQEWKTSISDCFEGYYDWLAEATPPNDVYCIPYKTLYAHIGATMKLYDLLKTSSPYKFKNRVVQIETFMKINSTVKDHYHIDTSGYTDTMDKSSRLQIFKGSSWDNVQKLKQLYNELDKMDDMWYDLVALITTHVNMFNSGYLNNSDKTSAEINDMRSVVSNWMLLADWVLERSTNHVKLVCRTLNTM